MSLAELLPSVYSLSRTDKLQLIQLVAQNLAEAEPASLIEPGQTYPVWSPDRSFSAAEALLQALSREGEAK